ncbi:MAG: phosphoglucosamine mutase, partial [Cyanobacteria bacterium]|nr:phosphoglucosamine mutase [Cyanobacteriota bacterium]
VIAPEVLKLFGAEVYSHNIELTGENINKGCGSTHPEFLTKAVLENKADIGFSYDGDGDRVIACDGKGRILDGDIMIAFCALYMLEKGTLKNNCVVTTVMANIGFDKVLEKKGIKIYKTNVGDRYVLEKMNETKCSLGGEQSGHIIFSDISPTGDGIISTLEFLNVLVNNDYDLGKIYEMVPKYPQTLKNVRVADKDKILSSKELKDKILEMEKRLEGNGRILVRLSGTEPLIRVMVEAGTQEIANQITSEIAEIILKSSQNL